MSQADAELVAAVAAGDRQALAELYARHAPWLVARLGRRCADSGLVDEAVQDTFVAVWRGAGKWSGRGDVAAWIWGIGVRRLVDGVRRPRPIATAMVDLVRPIARRQTVASAEEQVLLGTQYGDVGAALDRLSPELRAVVQATVLDGLTTREAGQLLGIPAGTVKTRMMRADRAEGGPRMTTWHANSALLNDYVSGATDYVLAASIETHLMACQTCRSRAASVVPAPRLDAIFAEVVDRIDAPRCGVIERALGRLRIRPDTARLLVATPLMRASWLAAVVAVLAFAALAASADDRGAIIFLTLAPLAPVAGVATAFGPRCDPAHEISVAAPYSTFRLLMLRALAVMATTTAGAALLSLFVPGGAGVVWAWLLPALALTSLTVAASDRVDATVAAAVIAGAWVCAVFAMRTESLPVFGPAGQLVFLVLALASATEIYLNRHRANLLRGAL